MAEHEGIRKRLHQSLSVLFGIGLLVGFFTLMILMPFPWGVVLGAVGILVVGGARWALWIVTGD
jgi:hypothetical protein